MFVDGKRSCEAKLTGLKNRRRARAAEDYEEDSETIDIDEPNTDAPPVRERSTRHKPNPRYNQAEITTSPWDGARTPGSSASPPPTASPQVTGYSNATPSPSPHIASQIAVDSQAPRTASQLAIDTKAPHTATQIAVDTQASYTADQTVMSNHAVQQLSGINTQAAVMFSMGNGASVTGVYEHSAARGHQLLSQPEAAESFYKGGHNRAGQLYAEGSVMQMPQVAVPPARGQYSRTVFAAGNDTPAVQPRLYDTRYPNSYNTAQIAAPTSVAQLHTRAGQRDGSGFADDDTGEVLLCPTNVYGAQHAAGTDNSSCDAFNNLLLPASGGYGFGPGALSPIERCGNRSMAFILS